MVVKAWNFECIKSLRFCIIIYIYSKLQTELFWPIGPHQCSAETWERLTQMRAFMPSLVLPALWARKHHAMPECSNYRGSELCQQWPATRHSQAECSTNSGCRDPNVGCICPRRRQWNHCTALKRCRGNTDISPARRSRSVYVHIHIYSSQKRQHNCTQTQNRTWKKDSLRASS